ncbi:hypothetical protein [Sulfurivermis fontis]|uniref:hypothetical protein n=1 Tax=Sulfurivermis fontis TaxID=1972068 RepID=UPI000FD8F4AB|nr:hypothetical protein [Sulfurivermis fontis]
MTETACLAAEGGVRCHGWPAAFGITIGLILITALFKWMSLPRVLHLPAPSDCALHERTCAAAWSSGRLYLTLGPRPLRCLVPLQVEMQLAGARPEAVEVDFQAVDVTEAFHRAVLRPVGERLYAGEAVLPLCSTGRVHWQAQGVIDYGGRRVVAAFLFETEG